MTFTVTHTHRVVDKQLVTWHCISILVGLYFVSISKKHFWKNSYSVLWGSIVCIYLKPLFIFVVLCRPTFGAALVLANHQRMPSQLLPLSMSKAEGGELHTRAEGAVFFPKQSYAPRRGPLPSLSSFLAAIKQGCIFQLLFPLSS